MKDELRLEAEDCMCVVSKVGDFYLPTCDTTKSPADRKEKVEEEEEEVDDD
jgi:hypothetical protein